MGVNIWPLFIIFLKLFTPLIFQVSPSDDYVNPSRPARHFWVKDTFFWRHSKIL